jgi:hypothetical protein
MIVLLPHDNYGFSVPVVFRSKALCAGKTQSTRFARGAGSGRTLVKHSNADAGHYRDALRVSLSRLTASPKAPTFGAPLANGATITCEARPVNLGKLTELAIIMRKEH